MKGILLIATLALATNVFAQDEGEPVRTNVVRSNTINVDGTVRERLQTDRELESIRAEIKKQKQETVLNKEKAKGFQQLSKSVEDLSETTEEYLLEKKSTQKQIAEYNEKVRCMQDEYPGKECDKYIKRK